MNHLPLEGITVVALEQAVSAAFATRQLADLEARVIPGGDFARGYDRTAHGHFRCLISRSGRLGRLPGAGR
jgi:crotonobetainyl-CoA:carnitine CoA-transferase CaiB-like acyl-CoA transferase